GSVRVGPAADPPTTPSTDPGFGVSQAHTVDRVSIRDDTHLGVGTACPSDEPAAQVVETATEVRLSVTYTATRFLCETYAPVTLQTPLGDRAIVDDATGAPVRIDSDFRCSPPASGSRCR